MFRKNFLKLLLVMLATASLGANAATFTYTGTVDVVTGSFAPLISLGAPLQGSIEVDGAAVAGGLAGAGDITDIGIAAGVFCFVFGAGTCDGGFVQITSIDAAAMTFVGGLSSGGTLDFTAFAPMFMQSIPISFDFDAGTFIASTVLGTVEGTGILSPAVVPVPPAIWFLGSALLGLFGMSRRGSTLSGRLLHA